MTEFSMTEKALVMLAAEVFQPPADMERIVELALRFKSMFPESEELLAHILEVVERFRLADSQGQVLH